VEEEICSEAAVEFVEVEKGILSGKFLEDFTERSEAIVISEDVADFEVRESGEKCGEPIGSGAEAGLFVAKSAPAEIEGVAVEDEEVRFLDLRVEVFEEVFSARSFGKEVEVGDDEAGFHWIGLG